MLCSFELEMCRVLTLVVGCGRGALSDVGEAAQVAEDCKCIEHDDDKVEVQVLIGYGR